MINIGTGTARKFITSGGTEHAQRDDKGKVIHFKEKSIPDPHGTMINIGTETAPRMVPVRHVQPVAKASATVKIPQSLLGGVKQEDAKRQRLAEAVNALAEHLKTVGTMYWMPPFRTQRDPKKIVTQFLRKLQDDATRQGILSANGLPDGAPKAAINLNNLDDWLEFHAAGIA